mmetsp:Transcript_83028/g.173827  ORF Transcript_83028/g.173827 Transcript_83028/m.173827 type:complete len:507 (+) Transcript_83028:38-1558(+)|eukprot:CAMPEP_0206476368 /NCGR_PEP_ID=MMETSP0324_2-20121206/34686_1 /ASSEMBLY_ACC=CAM_ASM_000836 /TAXON_ID=2866 /ORGANISM="Crypthecodinium cohnii, Strain Seligo" /LENGTH=506 /DNA_ID=CAMNT_0053952009 /DNA_START=30 /DNA_END=1550 /DNA_ORIENTATION=+
MKFTLVPLATLLLASQSEATPGVADVAKLEEDFRRAEIAAKRELRGVPKLLKSTEHLLEEAHDDLHLHDRTELSEHSTDDDENLADPPSAAENSEISPKSKLERLRKVEKLFGNVERLQNAVANGDVGEAEKARSTASQEEEDKALRQIVLAHAHHHRDRGHYNREEEKDTSHSEKQTKKSAFSSSSSSHLLDAAKRELKLGKEGRKLLEKLKFASEEVEDALGSDNADVATKVEDLLSKAEDAQVKATKADFAEAKISMAAARRIRRSEQEAKAKAKSHEGRHQAMLNGERPFEHDEAKESPTSALPASMLKEQAQEEFKLGSDGNKILAELAKVSREARAALGKGPKNTRVQALLKKAEDEQFRSAKANFLEAKHDLKALKTMEKSSEASRELGMLSLKAEASETSRAEAAVHRLQSNEREFFQVNHVLGEVKRAEKSLRGTEVNTPEGKELQALLQQAATLAGKVVVNQGKEWVSASKNLATIDPEVSKKEENRFRMEIARSS